MSSTVSESLTSTGSSAVTSSDTQFDNTSGNKINQTTMDFISQLPTARENITFFQTAKPNNTLDTRSPEYQMTSSVTTETTSVTHVFTSESTPVPTSTFWELFTSLNDTSTSAVDADGSSVETMIDVGISETSETLNSENSVTTTADSVSDFTTEHYSSVSTQTTDPVTIEATTPELATPEQVRTSVTRTESAAQTTSEITTQTTIAKLVESSKLTTDEMEISFEITTNFLMEETTQEIDKLELQEISEKTEAMTSQAGTSISELFFSFSLCKKN